MPNRKKSRVREHMSKTGMSYEGALHSLRGKEQATTPSEIGLDVPGLGVFDAPGIDVENYEVQNILEPFVLRAAERIERDDRRVAHFEVTPLGVRAVTEIDGGPPRYEDVAFDAGVYEKMVRLSRGPRVARPKAHVDGLVADMVSALDDLMFGPEARDGLIFLSPEDYAHVRYAHGGRGSERLDPTTKAGDMKRGWMGTLSASTAKQETRKREIWISRYVRRGFAHVVASAPEPGDAPQGDRIRISPPDILWAFERAERHVGDAFRAFYRVFKDHGGKDLKFDCSCTSGRDPGVEIRLVGTHLEKEPTIRAKFTFTGEEARLVWGGESCQYADEAHPDVFTRTYVLKRLVDFARSTLSDVRGLQSDVAEIDELSATVEKLVAPEPPPHASTPRVSLLYQRKGDVYDGVAMGATPVEKGDNESFLILGATGDSVLHIVKPHVVLVPYVRYQQPDADALGAMLDERIYAMFDSVVSVAGSAQHEVTSYIDAYSTLAGMVSGGDVATIHVFERHVSRLKGVPHHVRIVASPLVPSGFVYAAPAPEKTGAIVRHDDGRIAMYVRVPSIARVTVRETAAV